MKISTSAAIIAAGLASILSVSSVFAQDIDAQEREYIGQTRQNDWLVELGALYGAVPDYQGASALQGTALPYFYVEYKNRYFLHPTSGLGVYLYNKDDNFISTSLTYAFGRQEDDTGFLQGLGDIDGGVALRAAGQYRLKYGVVGAIVSHQVSGTDTGVEATLYASTRLKPSPRARIYPTVRVVFADSERQQALFGVTPAQAASSAFSAYSADGGVKSYGFQLQGLYDLRKNWRLAGQASWDVLVNDAADSPIVQDENQYLFTVGVIKSF